jgi:hypothetical protein
VDIPSGRIVSRVQVQLTTVKMCIYETEQPTIYFEFAESGSGDKLTSSAFLSDNCECNKCPVNQDGLDWRANEMQWRGSKQFTLEVNVEGRNSTLCINTLTIKLQFASESSHTFIQHSFLCKLTLVIGDITDTSIEEQSTSSSNASMIITVSVSVAVVVLVIVLVVVGLLVVRCKRKEHKLRENVALELEVRNLTSCVVILFVRTTSLRMLLLVMQLEEATLDRCTKEPGKAQLRLH